MHGVCMQVEDIEEEVPPIFAALLQRPIQSPGASEVPGKIVVGGVEVQPDTHFRLVLTTKLENPHYLPEIAMQVQTPNT